MPHHPTRILSIAFTHLPTDRIARMKWGKSWLLENQGDAHPIVVTDTVKNAIRIIAHDNLAKAKGIHTEQTLSDARALVPDLEYYIAEREKDGDLLFSLAAWCERYTPLVALNQSKTETIDYGLFMDISGCAHLFGGEDCMVAEIEKRFMAQGFHVRLGLADTPGAAWATARYGTQSIVSINSHSDAIKNLPMAALRIAPSTVKALSRVGLKTIGCIADLPRAPLATRFGRNVLQRLDQAFGVEQEAISPIMPVAELAAEKRFFEPIVYEDDIKQVIENLARNMVEPLERRGLGARACRIKLFRVDGNRSTLEVEAGSPIREPTKIARLFNEKIAGLHHDLDAGFGFDLIRLEIVRASAFENRQDQILLNDPLSKKSDEGYNALIDRLGARLGVERVQQFIVADTHIPERSFGFAACARNHQKAQMAIHRDQQQETLTRPLVLLDHPEQVETLAQIPDGAPIRFRWRKVLYEVARSEGPERIACEWWKDGRASLTRDYFRVEDDQGYRFWLFRFGLYGRETQSPQWYMHGLFA